jgi:hypothetical protein
MLASMLAPPRKTRLDRIVRFVETRTVKVTLVVLIILSVLPGLHLDVVLRPLFLAAFGLELAVRLIALASARPSERRSFERMFVLVDVLAFLSFLPLDQWLDERGVLALTMLRLARLLVLIRFARELAADLYSIITRREQLQQFGLVTMGVMALSFVSAVLLQHLNIGHPYDPSITPGEDTFIDRLWWSFRQLESADNLVASLRVHPLIAVLSLTLTIVGVFVVSFIIGIGANVVDQVVRAERRRAVGYTNHALVIGPVHDVELLVREFVALYERNRLLRKIRPQEVWQWLAHGGPTPRRHALPRMALLGPESDPPTYLYDPRMRWVVYRQGEGSDPEALKRVAASEAKRAILLARPDAGYDADAVTATALASFRALNMSAQVFVEVLDSENRSLIQSIGGPSTFPLDVPRFLGLFLYRHLAVVGVEHLFADLMTSEGSELYTHIFVEPEEHRAIKRIGEDGFLSFESMASAAYRDRGVVLTGVFLGEERLETQGESATVDGLERWLNPLLDPPKGSRAAALGARAGHVPVKALRGLIGVSASYAPLRRYARDLIMRYSAGAAPALEDPKRIADLKARIRDASSDRSERPRDRARVLFVGYSAALPTLLEELARSMHGVEVVLAINDRHREVTPVGQRLASIVVGPSEEAAPHEASAREVPLAHGGRLLVHTNRSADLASFAVKCAAQRGPFSAVVFFCEPDALDRDARTSMRLLRFVRALEHGEVPRGERLHLLAEFAYSKIC